MKSLVEKINEGAYDRTFVIPPFEHDVIMQALRAFKDNEYRKKHVGNGYPDDRQLDNVIKFMETNGSFRNLRR